MKIHFLPARYGDAIIVDYITDGTRRRFIIDGGTAGTRRDIRRILNDGLTQLELVVVSHIDRDHIEGLLAMLEEDNIGFQTRDFWFNGYPHLLEAQDNIEDFGAVQGERLTTALIGKRIPWNTDFQKRAVEVPNEGELPVRTLPGNMKLTLLGPTRKNLEELKPKWEEEVREANLDPQLTIPKDDTDIADHIESFDAVDIPDVPTLANSPFEDDDSKANRSSIAFIAEHDDKKVLFAGDSCVETLLAGLERYAPGQVVDLSLVKIPHHGSSKNISKQLMEKINCKRWMFSSNGSIYNHPKHKAVARVIEFAHQPELIFNYKSDENAIWKENIIQTMYGYSTVYPAQNSKGVTVTL